MRKKIVRAMIITLLIALFCLGTFVVLELIKVRSDMTGINTSLGDEAGQMSSELMKSQTKDMLTEMSANRAEIADAAFSNLKEAVEVAAFSAAEVYNHAEDYGASQVPLLSEEDIGKPKPMFAYADDVDPEDPAIQEECGRIANLQQFLKSANKEYDDINSNYFATETGIFLSVEEIHDYHLEAQADGQTIRFDARPRPWYQEAAAAGDTIFTSIFMDADTGAPSISCGTPVYSKDGKLLGVAGAGMYLDSMQEDILNYQIGSEGFFCILNQEGQILFSGREVGDIREGGEEYDIRKSSNTDLAELGEAAVKGEQGIKLIHLEDRGYYVAYAPMKVIGWSYIAILPEEEVEAPTRQLLEMIDSNTQSINLSLSAAIVVTIVIVVVFVVIVSIVVSFVAASLANRLVSPIEKLTGEVRKVEGDNLEFEWNQNTGDEVQTLADSFQSLTERMKKYIVDITAITAEKERIGAELSVATNIQASMLPSIFPPFPDRREFELYAKMDPAKEVGGDFYDFFMVDENHLAVVIADVSGKGVPASLFMVIAKTLIKNHAQLKEEADASLRNANNQLCEGNGEGLFVTAWIGILDLRTGDLDYADAGHDNPYVVHPDATLTALEPDTKLPPLAAMEDMPYSLNHTKINPGDFLFLYTDGVPEATNAHDELYDMERLEAVLKANYDCDPETFLVNVRADVDQFVGDAPQFDDLTMLGLRFKSLTGDLKEE